MIKNDRFEFLWERFAKAKLAYEDLVRRDLRESEENSIFINLLRIELGLKPLTGLIHKSQKGLNNGT